MRDSELAAFQRLRRKGRTIRDYAQRIDELEAQVTRLQSAIRHHCDHRANDMMRRQGFSAQEWSDTAKALAAGAGLHPGDLDPIGGSDDSITKG